MLVTGDVSLGPGVFIRRRAFELVGKRDERFRYVGDLDFWRRVALRGRLVHIRQPLATHRVHPDSASVSAKGGLMAAELIAMLDKAFADPALPEALRRLQPQIMAKAHNDAVAYCGADRRSALGHYLRYVAWDPVGFLWTTARNLARRLGGGA